MLFRDPQINLYVVDVERSVRSCFWATRVSRDVPDREMAGEVDIVEWTLAARSRQLSEGGVATPGAEVRRKSRARLGANLLRREKRLWPQACAQVHAAKAEPATTQAVLSPQARSGAGLPELCR